MSEAFGCPTCGLAWSGRYCVQCGERRVEPGELRMGEFLRSGVREALQVDGRLLRTLRTLFTKPGLLTTEYMRGRRMPYVSPLQLYLVISLVFFVLAPRIGYFQYDLKQYEDFGLLKPLHRRMVATRLAETGEAREAYAERFGRRLDQQKRGMMVFLVPGLAAALAVLYLRRGRPAVEHLVFGTHFFAAFLIWMVAGVPLVFFPVYYGARPLFSWADAEGGKLDELIFGEGEVALATLLIVPALWYLFRALQRVYGGRRWASWVRAAALSAWVLVLIILLYKESLFYTVFYSL